MEADDDELVENSLLILVKHTVKRGKDFDLEQALVEKRLPGLGLIAAIAVSIRGDREDRVARSAGLYSLNDKLELEEYGEDGQADPPKGHYTILLT